MKKKRKKQGLRKRTNNLADIVLPSWWNWYTHMLEVHGSQGRAGSSPAEGTAKNGQLAQWLEHLVYTEGVIGSSPILPTVFNRIYNESEPS